jgi:cyclopropane fatty-acyl-phospholipid synthase-like methyltransferase
MNECAATLKSETRQIIHTRIRINRTDKPDRIRNHQFLNTYHFPNQLMGFSSEIAQTRDRQCRFGIRKIKIVLDRIKEE